MDLVCLGEILIDMFPAEIGRKLLEVTAFKPTPGGAPANVAVAAARLGKRSAFIGKVGEDLFGQYLKDVLNENSVETRGMRIDPYARTTMAMIAMPDHNSAEFVFYRNPGADLMLRPDELDLDLLQNTKAYHFGSLSLVAEPARSATYEALKTARAAGALVSFDVNFRPSLWKDGRQAVDHIQKILPEVHLLKVNEVELELLAGYDDLEKASTILLKKGPEIVVVTLGSRGSYYTTPQASSLIPAFNVNTVDAIGCGDAFIAGLLSQFVSHEAWRSMLKPELLNNALRYANAVGALTSMKRGVIPALPTAAEVDAFLKKAL